MKITFRNVKSFLLNFQNERIHWYPHSPEAFKKAQKENKLVFVDLDAEWCLWCRKMEKETYYNPEVRAFLLKSFIPIRVDADKEPQLRKRYLKWGFPSYAILTPEGELLFNSSGYLKANDFLDVLRQAKTGRLTNSGEIDNGEFHIEDELELGSDQQRPSTPLEVPGIYVNELKQRFDKKYGGFSLTGLAGGGERKYPLGRVLIFLLNYLPRSQDVVVPMIKDSIAAIQNHSWDKKRGGFYRYCERINWAIPHTEKVLYDQVRLFWTFALAYSILGGQPYKRLANQTQQFIFDRLFNEETGQFFGFVRAEEKGVTDVSFTNYSAEAVFAFFQVSRLLNDKSLMQNGLNALRYLQKELYVKGEGLKHYFEQGQAKGPATLEDYGWSVLAFLQGYEVSQDAEFLVVARTLLREAWENNTSYLKSPPELDHLWTILFAYVNLFRLTGETDYFNQAESLAKKTMPLYQLPMKYAYMDAMSLEDKAGYSAAILQFEKILPPRSH